jgi:hypothetical protein
MTDEVKVTFAAEDASLIAKAKEVQKEMDRLSAKLKESGVSAAAYNKAMAQAKAATENKTVATQKARLSITDLNSAFSLAQQGLRYLQQGYEATVGATLEYANQVRQLSQISGESAENTSRFIQVLDDYKIGTEDAMAATRALTKQGLAPNIDTLAQLSDQYLKLTSAEEKNAFVIKNLGKSGLQWVEVLNKGSEAIRKQGDAVAEGLILNQEQLNSARELEIAQDALSESWQQLTMTIGNAAIPVLAEFVEGLNEGTRAAEIMREQGLNPANKASQEYRDALAQAKEEQEAATAAMLQSAEATEQNTQSLEEQEAQLKAVSEANQTLLSAVTSFGEPLQTWNDGLAEAKKELADGSITAEEYSTKVKQLGDDFREASNKIVLSMVEANLARDGWTKTEMNAYFEVGQRMGLFTEQQVAMGQAAVLSAEQITNSILGIEDPMMHVGERALDTAEDYGVMSDASYALTDASYEAAGGVGAVKSQINQMPPSGSSWEYFFTIHTKGRVPSLPGVNAPDTGQGHQLCFVKGTLVTMSDGTRKPIEQIQAGDEVRSYNTSWGEFTSGVVSKTMTRQADGYLNINGIMVTGEHPFWIVNRGEWVKAREIQQSDVLLNDYGGYKVVGFIFRVTLGVDVYNLTVEGEHNYFAGGVLVHNKSTEEFEDRDSGGYGAAGGIYMIGRGAQPEAFVAPSNGTFVPNADKMFDTSGIISAIEASKMDPKQLARAIRDVLMQTDFR